MATTKVNINGEEIDINFDTLSAEEAEKLGIRFKTQQSEEKKCKNTHFQHIRFSRIQNRITAALPLICTMVYLLLGFLLPNKDGWRYGWVVFFLIPIVPMLFSLSIRKGAQKYLAILSIIVVGVVVGLFFVEGAATWAWVLLFIIPISYTLFG